MAIPSVEGILPLPSAAGEPAPLDDAIAPQTAPGAEASPTKSPGSIDADLGRALADGLAAALAAGDMKAARVALEALDGLVDNVPETDDAPIVDLAVERRRRERKRSNAPRGVLAPATRVRIRRGIRNVSEVAPSGKRCP